MANKTYKKVIIRKSIPFAHKGEEYPVQLSKTRSAFIAVRGITYYLSEILDNTKNVGMFFRLSTKSIKNESIEKTKTKDNTSKR